MVDHKHDQDIAGTDHTHHAEKLPDRIGQDLMIDGGHIDFRSDNAQRFSVNDKRCVVAVGMTPGVVKFHVSVLRLSGEPGIPEYFVFFRIIIILITEIKIGIAFNDLFRAFSIDHVNHVVGIRLHHKVVTVRNIKCFSGIFKRKQPVFMEIDEIGLL